jgi:Tfp pilus assembly protein PilF
MRRLLALIAIVLAAGGVASAARADEDDIMRSQRYLMAGDVARAIESINEVIAEDPDYAPAYLLRARIWHMTGNFKKAAEDYSQAIAHGLDRSPYMYTMRADARFRSGDPMQAVADLDQALKLDPGYWPAIAGRGIALAETGETARALADLDRALARDPGDIKEVLTSTHVRVLSRKGPPGRGSRTLSVTVHSLPIMAASHMARGKLRFGQSAYNPALQDFDEVIRRAPNTMRAHMYRGLALLALGRCEEGKSELDTPGLRETAQFREAATAHRDTVSKAGCSVEMP